MHLHQCDRKITIPAEYRVWSTGYGVQGMGHTYHYTRSHIQYYKYTSPPTHRYTVRLVYNNTVVNSQVQWYIQWVSTVVTHTNLSRHFG